MTTEPPAYVYIASDGGASGSFVGLARSLLDMDWISLFGVDRLVWFEGFGDEALARTGMMQLRSLSEDDRRAIVLRYNPEQSDLSHRVWSSDPEDG